MSRRKYANGVLMEEYDDATLTYRRFVNGEVVEERTFTPAEVAAIIGAGAVFLDRRSLVVTDDAGNEVMRIGDMDYGDRGMTIRRQGNGAIAFEMKKTFSNSTNQSVYIRDDQGVAMLSEESLGNGISVPYFDIPLVPVSATSTAVTTGPWGPEVVVNSGTFTSTHQAWMTRANHYGIFKVRVAASDLTTAAEVRVINVATGNPIAPFFQAPWLGARAAGSTGYTEVSTSTDDGLILPGSTHERISVAVQVRRTAGTGTLTVAVPTAHGWTA